MVWKADGYGVQISLIRTAVDIWFIRVARLSEKYISTLVKIKRNIKLIALGMTNIKMLKEPKK